MYLLIFACRGEGRRAQAALNIVVTLLYLCVVVSVFASFTQKVIRVPRCCLEHYATVAVPRDSSLAVVTMAQKRSAYIYRRVSIALRTKTPPHFIDQCTHTPSADPSARTPSATLR